VKKSLILFSSPYDENDEDDDDDDQITLSPLSGTNDEEKCN
jgi:hypothetical protein